MGFVIIIIIIIAILWYLANRQSPEEKEKERIEKKKQMMFSVEYPQLQRIINESLEIINRTKNVDTAISRFDVIKADMQRILEIMPISVNLSMQIQNNNIHSLADLDYVDKAKTEWIKNFFKDKIDIEIQKANLLSNSKLRSTQLKKVLNITLKAIDYIPNDEDIKNIIINIENRLDNMTSDNEQKKVTLKEWSGIFRKAIKNGEITSDELQELEDFEKKAGLTDKDTEKHWQKAIKMGVNIDTAT